MTINVSRLQPSASDLQLQTTNPKHFALSENGAPTLKHPVEIIGTQGSQSFEKLMLRALDGVSGDQLKASAMVEKAITEPGTVDIHDITIAQAKASMSLNITRTVLSRIVQSWKDIVNTR